MRIEKGLADTAILQVLGARVTRYRLNQGLTQGQLAAQAGVAKRTVERIESGRGAELLTFIKVLRVLNLVETLDLLIPELSASPVDQMKLQGRQRRRVRHPRRLRASSTAQQATESTSVAVPAVSTPAKSWKWGEG